MNKKFLLWCLSGIKKGTVKFHVMTYTHSLLYFVYKCNV